ncbi:MAG: RNA 3'-terminal phosphate cyclase [Nanoarchaeota archaeon]|nr:RNA 3'-terminal phosphate cyclase [Nanoarchaeota archaeon]
MIHLDGSYLEGGGQIVRTALALSTITEKSFKVDKIRLGRPKPGLKAQHLHCIKALEDLCSAKTEGATLGSTSLTYIPGHFKVKPLSIDIGTAGSVSLFLQALLIPCLFGSRTINLNIKGGTDGKWAMPFDYLNNVFLPQIRKYAKKIEVRLLKRGYYPKGGGEIELSVTPKFNLQNIKEAPMINLTKRGNILLIKGVSHASINLEAPKVADRQAKAAELALTRLQCPAIIQKAYYNSHCPGSGIVLWALCGDKEMDDINPVIIGGDALGERYKSSEQVGKEAADNLLKELNAPVDSHMADNLIPFLALFGGSIKVSQLTEHTKTNIYVSEQFLGKIFEVKDNLITAA